MGWSEKSRLSTVRSSPSNIGRTRCLIWSPWNKTREFGILGVERRVCFPREINSSFAVFSVVFSDSVSIPAHLEPRYIFPSTCQLIRSPAEIPFLPTYRSKLRRLVSDFGIHCRFRIVVRSRNCGRKPPSKKYSIQT